MYWLFGILFYLDAYLPEPGCRGKGLTFLSLDVGARALHFPQGRVPRSLLGLEGEEGRGVGEQAGNGRRRGSGNFEW